MSRVPYATHEMLTVMQPTLSPTARRKAGLGGAVNMSMSIMSPAGVYSASPSQRAGVGGGGGMGGGGGGMGGGSGMGGGGVGSSRASGMPPSSWGSPKRSTMPVPDDLSPDAVGSAERGGTMSPANTNYAQRSTAGSGGDLHGLLQAMEVADVERQSRLHSAQVRRQRAVAYMTACLPSRLQTPSTHTRPQQHSPDPDPDAKPQP